MAEDGRSPHLHWIDALKVLVVGGIAFFHAFLVFSGRPWLVNNPQPDIVMAAFDGFVYQWGMALMFVLAGATGWFTLRRHSPLRFLSLRWRRLGIPFVIGLAVLSPLQWYAVGGGTLDLGRLLAAYPAWLRSVRLTWHLSSTAGVTYHLWFLLFLLAISTAALPVMGWLRTGPGRSLVGWMAAAAGGRFGFLVLAVPVAAVSLAVEPAFPTYEDWGDLARFGAVFVAGYVLVSDSRFTEGLRRQGRTTLVTAISLSVGLGLLAPLGILGQLESHAGYTPAYLAFTLACAINMWAWVSFCLSLGVRLLDGDSRTFRRLGELSLPFYVLHHPVLVLLAVQVVKLDWAPWPKVTLILAGTLSITYTLCLVVERTPALRAFFGLHAPPPSTGLRPRFA